MSTMRTLILSFFILFSAIYASAEMEQITGFGSNPGNLEMYLFSPSSPKDMAEVVVVLHGCGQEAENFAEQTGWNDLAEQYGFYVVYAQQVASNNAGRCFNWFRPSDNRRGMGEAKSIVEMVNYVHDNFATDPVKSFVCGLSAGGSMTPVMMATYPEVFAAGGVWAGVPYQYRSTGNNDLSPSEWGSKVRDAYPEYTGAYPTLFICQGEDDAVTEPINASRLVDQWTDVHGTDNEVDEYDPSFLGNQKIEEYIYLNNANDTIIRSYLISDMGHGIAVDPGSGAYQGGKASTGAYDVDFYSTYWMAKFFGLLEDGLVKTVDAINEVDIRVSTYRNGALKIENRSSTRNLTLLVQDLSGRMIERKNLNRVAWLTSGRLPSNKILVVTVLDSDHRSVYSKVVLR